MGPQMRVKGVVGQQFQRGLDGGGGSLLGWVWKSTKPPARRDRHWELDLTHGIGNGRPGVDGP